ncbi:response regulator transcription factor [Rhodopila sp.]|uniref:response regulator transcription factor n=1 Tax=Rhodopila sp. TaxID=2480087 RepID=UPI003D1274BE
MTKTRSILIAEHDGSQHQILAESVTTACDFKLTLVTSFKEADELLAVAGAHYDGIVLSLQMPDGDGYDYCAKLRRLGYKMPIITTAVSCDEGDVIRALDAGANDYVTKPLRPNELLARMRTHLRVFDDSENAVFMIGRYTFRPAAKHLHDQTKNKTFRLTEKETAILKFLYRAGAVPVTRVTLLDRVWGYNSGVNTHTLETHIYRLRQKIEANPSNCQILLTVEGGYRLNASGNIAAAA